MLINVLVLPLTAIGSATLLFDSLHDEGVLNFAQVLSKNILTHQYSWMRLVIHMTFISNAASLADLPHTVMLMITKRLHEYKQRDSAFKTQFHDTYEFDIPFQHSYCLVVFLGCLLFSSLAPLVPIYGSLFFLIKYKVDKYNLVFRYFHQPESGGIMRQLVQHYLILYMAFYLVVVTLFFYFNFQSIYHILGLSILCFWLLIILIFKRVIESSERFKKFTGKVVDL